MWLRGSFYGFLAILHAVTVIGALLYLPFGKFFHIFQRPAQLGVKLYEAAGREDEGTACARCGRRYASRMQIEDLRRVLPALGFDYRIDGPAATWQGLCPACKRASLATAQLRLKDEARGRTAAVRWSARRHVRPASQLRAARRVGRGRAGTPGRAGQDPLLVLRDAVRHPAQGARQHGR